MSVVIRRSEAVVTAAPTPYENEHELEQILADRVDLLRTPTDPPLAFVSRQVKLLDAGILDVMCVDADGLPVAVEVKLRRNGESRRAVVAQIVDYLSALTAMTVDELDEEVDGSLEAALRSFDEEAEDDGFERRWKAFGANLRAGLARVIVALDSSADDLRRIVRFLSENSNLDIRLLEIAKFVESGTGTVYVPNVVVHAEGSRIDPDRTPPVPVDVFLAKWKSDVGSKVAGAWDEFAHALEAAGIEGLEIGSYPTGVPRLNLRAAGEPVKLMRLADPRVSPAELRDMLHKGPIWENQPSAKSARETFREALLALVPGARISGGVGRVYMPVEGLAGRSAGVVAAMARLAAEIA